MRTHSTCVCAQKGARFFAAARACRSANYWDASSARHAHVCVYVCTARVRLMRSSTFKIYIYISVREEEKRERKKEGFCETALRGGEGDIVAAVCLGLLKIKGFLI